LDNLEIKQAVGLYRVSWEGGEGGGVLGKYIATGGGGGVVLDRPTPI